MDRGAWWATVYRVTESWVRLSNQYLYVFVLFPIFKTIILFYIGIPNLHVTRNSFLISLKP